jgi:hypothetical protein
LCASQPQEGVFICDKQKYKYPLSRFCEVGKDTSVRKIPGGFAPGLLDNAFKSLLETARIFGFKKEKGAQQ